jgi:hypothetical protein
MSIRDPRRRRATFRSGGDRFEVKRSADPI